MAERELKLSQLVEKRAEDDVIVTFRDIVPPETPPYLEEGTELFDIVTEPESLEEVDRAFGGRPNVPAANVVKAIRRDIGTKGYSLHISDRSYTGYSIWEVYKFVRNSDNTNYMRYIPEVFDCDDFAQVLQGNVNRILKGIPFGTIWYYGKGWGHAVNIGYCHKQDRIYLVEPQNDKFYRFNKKAWRAGMIII
ncbi:MAG: hypothetical protein AB4372_34340 [Xenococcus sp. (in: cyanobacteria)]